MVITNLRRYYQSTEPTGGTPPAGNGDPAGQSGGGSGNPGNPSPQPGGQQQQQQEPPKPVVFTAEQQEELNKIIGRTRTEARDAAQKEYDSKLQKLKDDAAADEAAKKGEFEKLYNEEKAKRTEFEAKLPVAEAKVKSLAERVNTGIDAETKDWPESIKKSDPGKEVDVEVRLQWVDNMRDIAKELSGRRAPNTGFGGGAPSGGPNSNGNDPTAAYLQNTYARPDAVKK